jgi:hypothetical protein
VKDKSQASKDKPGKDRKKKKHKSRPEKLKALPAPDRAHDPNLLDVSRIQWQHGDWAELARLDDETLTNHPERARLALIVAAAHAQLGDTGQARVYAGRALDWGCNRTVAAQVLISSAHNALARVATAMQDPSASAHFTAALGIVEPNGDLPLLSRSRQIRETARMGLLPEAADLLAIDLARVALAPADHAAHLAMLDTRLTELRRQVSLNPGPALQQGATLWVLDRSDHKRGGYFVDLGAGDGVQHSNTLMLERDYAWTGLLAEPNPDALAALQRDRTSPTSPLRLTGRAGEMADFLRRHNAPRQIDYLCLDSLGNELEILTNLPFLDWTIRLITVKTTQRDKVHALLQRHGYVRTPHDAEDWYELTPPPA